MSTLLNPKGIIVTILKEGSSNVSGFSFKVRTDATRSTIYTNCLHYCRDCVVVAILVRYSFIKTLLLALRIVTSEFQILKGIGTRLYFIVLSKSMSFPLPIEIARSLLFTDTCYSQHLIHTTSVVYS